MVHKRKYLLPALLFLLIIGMGTVFLIFNYPKSLLSDAQIKEKFGCNQLTFVARQTDIFCSKPWLYRNPESMTEAEYTAWQRDGCDERLSSPLTPEQRSQNAGIAAAYDDCLNKPSLHEKYIEFVQNVKRLRESN